MLAGVERDDRKAERKRKKAENAEHGTSHVERRTLTKR
jgi:hypothetical protein